MSTPRASSFVTARPVAVLMVFLAAVVFGFLSFGRLPVTLMPELTYPTLTVRTEYPGSAPEEVENDISSHDFGQARHLPLDLLLFGIHDLATVNVHHDPAAS